MSTRSRDSQSIRLGTQISLWRGLSLVGVVFDCLSAKDGGGDIPYCLIDYIEFGIRWFPLNLDVSAIVNY